MRGEMVSDWPCAGASGVRVLEWVLRAVYVPDPVYKAGLALNSGENKTSTVLRIGLWIFPGNMCRQLVPANFPLGSCDKYFVM